MTVRIGYALAMAAATGAPLRVADPLMDQLAVPAQDEASRLAGLGGTITCVLQHEGLDHYAVGMKDPEGNEFDIN